MSRSMRIIFASGYVAMSSGAKATAGGFGGDGAVGAEEGVPLAEGEGGPAGEEFGVLSEVPGGAVVYVGEEEGGVVAVVAEDVEGGLDGWGLGVEGISPVGGGAFSWSFRVGGKDGGEMG